MKSPSCGALIVTGIVFAALFGMSDLAVGRWGAVAFWPILIVAVAESLWLLRTAALGPLTENLNVSLPFLIAMLISGMRRELGLSFWQGLLIALPFVTVTTFLASRVLRTPESPRDNAG
jgi:hypothetical protein